MVAKSRYAITNKTWEIRKFKKLDEYRLTSQH